MNKKGRIITGIIIAIIVVLGGGYLFASHAVAKKVPGHVYQYTSVSKNQNAYMTFSKSGDQVVVTPSKEKALEANSSSSNFQKVYQDQSQDGQWNYRAKGSKLTLTKTQNNQTSLWQYNRVLALGKTMHSGSFTYQIANAGQGIVHKGTSFKQVQ